MNRFYITTPIYYVNAAPHIGHAYTTIAADALARYHRARLGSDAVFYLTGTDEHGGKIYEKALSEGKSPQVFCDEISQKFKDVWSSYGVSHNKFIRTTDVEHKNFVKKFMLALKDSGALYESEYEGLYCVGCENFITSKELIEGRCPYHKTEPELVLEKNWFFNLQKYLPEVISKIKSDELSILPAGAKSEVLGLVGQGVPDFSVSRSKEKIKWGIELPWDDSQLVYVWCDALTNYLSGALSDAQTWWPANMQLMAKDILKFHALYWPALLLATGYELPEKMFIHGFFTINGSKMSKSLGNVIDPMDLLERFGVDGARYLLLTQFPFGQDGDINKDRLVEKYNAELSNGLGNLFNRITVLTEKYMGGLIPSAGDPDGMREALSESWLKYTECMEVSYRLDGALFEVRHLIGLCDKYITESKLWEIAKTDVVRAGEMIYNVLELLMHISLMIEPFMPDTSRRIRVALCIDDSLNSQIYSIHEWGILKSGSSISKSPILFPKKAIANE